MKPLPKILVIVGPTASGKTDLAIRLAKKLGGEIVSADSRLLYKGMNIGTAKPSPKERRGIPHHLIDVVPPSKTMTLSDYQRKAARAIRGILRRKHVPILVGGTGLYVRAIVDNLEIPRVPPDPRFRARLQKWTAGRILKSLRKADPAYADRVGPNPRYAVRALEVMRATGKTMTELQKRGEPRFDACFIGLKPPKGELERRIRLRVGRMIRGGLIEETRRLLRRYDPASPAMSGIGYREIGAYLRGEISLKEASERIETRTRQYAKRQMTWFKRDARIRWHPTPVLALKTVLACLALP